MVNRINREGTFRSGRLRSSPTITSLIIPARATPGSVVTWSARDNLTNISHYDVHYTNESGVWAEWQVSIPVTQTVFAGPSEHAYILFDIPESSCYHYDKISRLLA